MKKIHYGWFVCLGCALLMFCTSGLSLNAFTVYQPYIMKFNGFTNSRTSSIITVRSLFSLISMLLAGKYYKLLSLRSGMAIAAFLDAASFLVFGLAQSYVMYCVASALAGAAFGFGTMIPISIMISRWFIKKRTFAVSICSAATGLSTLGIPSALTWLIENKGMRITFLGEAVVVTGIAFACTMLIANEPADKGLLPYGAGEMSEESKKAAEGKDVSKLCWALLVPMLLLLGAMANTGYVHLSVLMVANGYTPQITAIAIMVSGLIITIGKCLYGAMADRITAYKCNYIFGVILIIGLGMLCLPGVNIPVLMTASALYGLGLAMPTIGLPAWAGDLSSAKNYDRTIRLYQTGYSAGSFIFAQLPGVLADRFGGSYIPAYVFFTFCAVFVLVSIQIVYRSVRDK